MMADMRTNGNRSILAMHSEKPLRHFKSTKIVFIKRCRDPPIDLPSILISNNLCLPKEANFIIRLKSSLKTYCSNDLIILLNIQLLELDVNALVNNANSETVIYRSL